jgi:ketol-acid reductoisomerase
LQEIQDGRFARRWIEENQTGRKTFQAMREAEKEHEIEKVGAKLREMMVWVNRKETVKQ